MAAHAADNYTCTDQRLSTGGANSTQPASGCVFLRHMCERSREEKRQRAAGTNPSATQITSGLSGHIGAQRAWWDMPPRGAKQARWHTDTGAGKEGRKNRGWHILPFNAQYVKITRIQLWMATLTTLCTNYTVTPCHHSCTRTYNHTYFLPPTHTDKHTYMHACSVM